MLKTIQNIISFVALLWLIVLVDYIFPYDLCQHGIVPKSLPGLQGIIFAPFLHASFGHILSNSVPLFVLLLLLYKFYAQEAVRVIIYSTLLANTLVWFFARPAVHVGISGLIYSLAAFLIVAGFRKRDFRSLAISALIIFLYGGMIWGLLPIQPWMSWEGHLFGAIAGIFMAVRMKKRVQSY